MDKEIMEKDIINNKVEITIELVCHLFKNQIITNAFIVGSVAKGTAKKESDIDLVLVNPFFIEAAELPPPEFEGEFIRTNINLAKILKNMGAEFKQLLLKDIPFWYQLYKGEKFHIITLLKLEDLADIKEYIEINRDMC